MNVEEELKALKLQVLKRGRVTAVVLGLSAVIAVIFMIYGFTQSIEAGRQRVLSEHATRVAEKCAQEKLEYKNRAEVAEKEISDRNEADKLAAEKAINLVGKASQLPGSNKSKK